MKYYEESIAKTECELSKRRRRNKPFVVCEVLAFLAGAGMLVLYTTALGEGWMPIATVLLVVLYFFIRKVDACNARIIRDLDDTKKACERELHYLNGNFDDFDDGAEYADAAHPFALDLDIFGSSSLFQRVCRGVTTGGCEAIADALKLKGGAHCERREAINELSGRPELLTDFKRMGQRGVTNTAAVGRAFRKLESSQMPKWACGKTFRIAISVYTILFLVALSASVFTQNHLLPMVWWSVANFFVAFLACNRTLVSLASTVDGLVRQLDVYRRLIEIMDGTQTSETVINDLKKRISGAGLSLQTLSNTLQKLESRCNILGLIVFDTLFLWDFRILSGFATWQRQYANRFNGWIEAVGEFDMLVSFATFKYNEARRTTDAEVVDSDGVVFEARGIFHPFLGENAVGNDFSIVNHNFYIITGANMAGKSTFLRCLGINYVLAMNGLPVFAESLVVSRFALFTSMRTTDDLTHGISYFNAELLRLRQILDSLSGGKPHLIILDEILKGTNSEDKLSGSRMFLEYVATKNVTGIIATHDLKLSEMADAYPGRFHNYCFEIDLGDDVTYSYKISEGVAKNQNATFLLKKMLGEASSQSERKLFPK